MSGQDDDWILYRNRAQWSDIQPVSQDDGPQPVVAICYSEKFRDAFDYFRGVLAVGEKSQRVLNLTTDCLDLNPSNYTVWQYRREILKECNFDLHTELNYTQQMIKKSEKNYQVWHHRRVIVEWLGDANNEDDFTRELLAADPKNYHAWQYRQWYIRKFNKFNGELKFVEEMLQDDIRNNSAWNQRYFVINNSTGFSDEHAIHREIDFTLSAIERVTENESAWNYLRGLWFHLERNSVTYNHLKEFIEAFYEKHPTCRQAIAFLIDIYAEDKDNPSNFTKAINMCNKLAHDLDKIRRNYWSYMANRIKKNLQETVS